MAKGSNSFCPECNALGYRTLQTRVFGDDISRTPWPSALKLGIKPRRLRRKECPSCGHRESTLEINADELEAILARAVKLDELLRYMSRAVERGLENDF